MTFAATQRPPYDKRDTPVVRRGRRRPQVLRPALPARCPLEPPVNFKNGTDGSTRRAGATPNEPASRNTKTTVAAIKLGIFVLVSVIVTGTLTAIMGSFAFGSETEYKADFSSASLIQKGDDVRVAGVTVGSVKNVEIKNRDRRPGHLQGEERRARSPPPTRASIRFLNLVGDRYMALEEGQPGAKRLADGGTIPVSHTTPALNLTELFNGFQPLFQALSPSEVNELSLNLVKVLQGEGGTISSLLTNTASLTNALADRDQLIGAGHRQPLGRCSRPSTTGTSSSATLVVQLKDWMGNLSARPQDDRRLGQQPLRPDRRGRRPADAGPAATSRPTSPSCDAADDAC